MSLVRLLGFTTLACGCVVGRYREVATSHEVMYVEEKGQGLREPQPPSEPHGGDRAAQCQPDRPFRERINSQRLEDDTGAGADLRTYSLRNQTAAPFRITFTSICRRRFVGSGFFEMYPST